MRDVAERKNSGAEGEVVRWGGSTGVDGFVGKM